MRLPAWFVSLLVGLVFLSGSCQPIVPPTAIPAEITATPAEATAIPAEPTATPAEPSTVRVGPRPARILIIGGGWTSFGQMSLDALLHGIAAAAEPDLNVETQLVFLDGSSLKDQWDTGKALQAIRDGNWDVVVLEQNLDGAASNVGYYAQTVTTFQEYVRLFYDEISATGAQTVLFAGPAPFVKKKGVDDYYQANLEVAAELGVKVAPVGYAMVAATQADASFDFVGLDHLFLASVQGLYLTAAVLYATIYDRSPEGITWLPADDLPADSRLDDVRRMVAIEPEMRDLLLRVAWETVQNYP